jgi:hypothetical protein
MALSNIRTEIKAKLETVTNVGVVNDFEPHAARQEDFETYFRKPELGYILGWSITRESTTERDFVTEQNMAAHLMVIRGYRALETGGSTEKAFQDLIETVRVTLRKEQRDQLGLVNQGVVFVGPPQVRIVEPRMFGGFLVHYCEITLVVQEDISVVV